jgi:alkanesulfonate monooxygenase SsuD/methylene tetrahydromethanopterin reductase-like flavin-dependent oxidoreductase (luciferase family)
VESEEKAVRIGLVNQLHGRPEGRLPAPTWEAISARAAAAEEAGFDIFVFEDALLYRWESGGTDGVWESVSMAAALSATTSRMKIGHSVVNSPYRSPAMLASIATTLDEISSGRYVLGIGAGNTFDSDYDGFGFPKDHRYSRFAEAIEIVHTLLKKGRVDFEGEYYSAKDAELVLRGPSPTGPPINIAGGGPKMLGLVARYADEWNWWGWDETVDQIGKRLDPILESLELACEELGRDPSTLVRTFDLYSVVPGGLEAQHGLENPVTGSDEEIARYILSLADLGFEEVRCDVWPKGVDAIERMAPIVKMVHDGR